MLNRREFLRVAGAATGALAAPDLSFALHAPQKGRFAISLACLSEWRLRSRSTK